METTGTITSFTTTPKSSLYIGGEAFTVETAGKSYSLTEPDSQTLRFEIQAGDQAWFDAGSAVDRSEIQDSQMIAAGTPINISYQFMVEPGSTNTASWLVAGEMHNDDPALGSSVHTSPPFAIQLDGDHLQVVARYCPTGLDPSNAAGNVKTLTLWTDPNPIQRGQYSDINIQANVSNTSSGYLEVWVNGTEVVNYHGPLGYGAPTYWEEGLYRSTTNQDIAADYRNLSITTGSAATTTSGGTTSSGSTSSSTTTTGSTTGSASTGTTSSGSTTVTTPTGSSSSSTTGSSSGGTSTSGTATSKAPIVTIADSSLSVSPGGSVSLGLGVIAPHAGDDVSVTISGLPKYETITDNLDHKTFTGSSITLSAAQVNSGVWVTSYYKGQGQPTATLTVSAHDSTGTPVTSAARTITVKDPPATTASSSTSSTSSATSGSSSSSSQRHHGTAVTATSPDTSTASSASRSNVVRWFGDHPDFAPAATTLGEAGSRSTSVSSSATAHAAPSAGSKAYALLNQVMARDFSGEAHFAQAPTALSSPSQHQTSLLAKPTH